MLTFTKIQFNNKLIEEIVKKIIDVCVYTSLKCVLKIKKIKKKEEI